MRRWNKMRGPDYILLSGRKQKKSETAKKKAKNGKEGSDERAKLGRMGEKAALEYLLQYRYKLLERNWRHRRKEVDLIMESGDGIHIVEVKSRKEPVLVEPERSVDLKKQTNLEAAAGAYLKSRRLDADVHFDIVTVIFDTSDRVRHISFIKDAFYPIRKRC